MTYRLRCWIRERFGRWEVHVVNEGCCEQTIPALTYRQAAGFADVIGWRRYPPDLIEVRRRT